MSSEQLLVVAESPTGATGEITHRYRSEIRLHFIHCVVYTRPGSDSHEIMIEVKSEDQILRVGTLKDVKQEFSVLVKL